MVSRRWANWVRLGLGVGLAGLVGVEAYFAERGAGMVWGAPAVILLLTLSDWVGYWAGEAE